jgi:hypothetical protein
LLIGATIILFAATSGVNMKTEKYIDAFRLIQECLFSDYNHLSAGTALVPMPHNCLVSMRMPSFWKPTEHLRKQISFHARCPLWISACGMDGGCPRSRYKNEHHLTKATSSE